MADSDTDYQLKAADAPSMPAPDLPYQPLLPRTYRPAIGLIGCGGITRSHLAAYRTDGLRVAALCDLREDSARERRDAFYPEADLYTDHRALLEDENIEVVDVALHPGPRAAVIEDALRAGKHVLSQKPFVLDLDEGLRLVELAESLDRKLAVNQNGRWAPYVRFADQAVRDGLLGSVQSVDIGIQWDHSWIQGTRFERIHHILLFDFAVHWLDMTAMLFGDQRALRVGAGTASARTQPIAPPLTASAAITFEQGCAALALDGFCRQGAEESLTVTGDRGTLRCRGPVCACDHIILVTEDGVCRPRLEGAWFDDGFRGAMGELLCAIEEDRDPSHAARNNLRSLEIVFAVVEAADTGRTQVPGDVRRVGATCMCREP